MTPTVTKHRTVLHWFESMNRNMRSFEPIPSTGPQMFVTEEAPPNAWTPGSALRMEYDTWQAMGGPLTLTVTVEPGDLLNVLGIPTPVETYRGTALIRTADGQS